LIYIQTEKEVYSVNYRNNLFSKLSTPKHKIVNILSEDKEFLYSTIIDANYIDFYKCGIEEKVASYNLNERTLDLLERTSEELFLITEYIADFETKRELQASDIHGENILEIKEERLSTQIILNKKRVIELYGRIDRAFFLGKEIIFTIASFHMPTEFRTFNTMSST